MCSLITVYLLITHADTHGNTTVKHAHHISLGGTEPPPGTEPPHGQNK